MTTSCSPYPGPYRDLTVALISPASNKTKEVAFAEAPSAARAGASSTTARRPTPHLPSRKRRALSLSPTYSSSSSRVTGVPRRRLSRRTQAPSGAQRLRLPQTSSDTISAASSLSSSARAATPREEAGAAGGVSAPATPGRPHSARSTASTPPSVTSASFQTLAPAPFATRPRILLALEVALHGLVHFLGSSSIALVSRRPPSRCVPTQTRSARAGKSHSVSKWRDVELLSHLGAGSCGVVYYGRYACT